MESLDIQPPVSSATSNPASASKPRRRFVGSSTRPSKNGGRRPGAVMPNAIPDDILNNKELNEAIKALPSNYSFEIHKTIHQLRQYSVRTVALQLPEGLLIYGPIIADILESFTSPPVQPLLLADVTYGACCIDDYTAKSMGAEMIVHYGHSCLIPVSQTTLRTLYIFVEIQVDPLHLALSVRRNFPSSKFAFRRQVLDTARRSDDNAAEIEIGLEDIGTPAADVDETQPTRLALVSTIQFISAVQDLRDALTEPLPPIDGGTTSESSSTVMTTTTSQTRDSLLRARAEEIGVWRGKYDIVVPQVRPLSPGEVLGCTAPKLDDNVDALIYVGDGRFHLESVMIANPTVPAFRYDPYDKRFTREGYDHDEMRKLRGESVIKARKSLMAAERVKVGEDVDVRERELQGNDGAGGWAVVLGTLGRQGSLSVLNTIKQSLPRSAHPPFLLLLSELSPQKLDLLPPSLLSTFVQTSCPRLSIDWGYAFSRPLLSPYEASVAVGRAKGWKGLEAGADSKEQGKETLSAYPMDFYSDDSLGPWTPRHGMGRPLRPVRATA